jgi:hypothetical protein
MPPSPQAESRLAFIRSRSIGPFEFRENPAICIIIRLAGCRGVDRLGQAPEARELLQHGPSGVLDGNPTCYRRSLTRTTSRSPLTKNGGITAQQPYPLRENDKSKRSHWVVTEAEAYVPEHPSISIT